MRVARKLRIVAALVTAVATACTYVDTEAPAPPVLGDVPAKVRSAKVSIQGWAEPGTAVSVTRDPPFDTAPSLARASEYTGVFRFEDLPLAAATTNTLSFLSTDTANLVSKATTVSVVVDERPDGLTLGLLRDVVVAGATDADGTLEAWAELEYADPGAVLADRQVTFTLAGVSTESKQADTDENGRAHVTFTGLTTPGAGTIVANYGAANGEPQSRPAAFRVIAGPVASLTVALAPTGGTGGGTTLSVQAGTTVDVTTVATDGSGNVLSVPVVVSTNAPGAAVAGGRISGLAEAGRYEVVASVAGVSSATGLVPVARATLDVTPAAASVLRFVPPSSVVAGETFVYDLGLEDAFGNAVAIPTGSTVAVTSTLPAEEAAFDTGTTSGSIRRAGSARLTASVTPPGGTAKTADATVDVRAAAPATVTVSLAGTDADPSTADVLDVDASASTTIPVGLAAKDAFGNAVTAAIVGTVSGNVLFDGSSLRRLTTAGAYEFVASIPGTLAGGRAAFTVRPGAATTLSLALAKAASVAGESVGAVAAARDAFGNAAAEPLVLAVDTLAADRWTTDLTAGTVTVRAAGTATVRLRSSRTGSNVPAAVTQTLTVAVGPAASAVLAITPSNDVRAGDKPNVAVTVSDAFANVIASPSVAWAVAPLDATLLAGSSPIVTGGKVQGLVRPGRYRVVATVTNPDGTAITSDPADPEGEVRVTAGAAAEVVVNVTPDVLELGTAVTVSTQVRDAFGNTAPGTVTVAIAQGASTLASSLAGTTWVPPSTGTFTFTGSAPALGADPAPPAGTKTISVLPRVDATPPAITFQRPANDPTIAAWPPPGAVTPNACSGNAGDVFSVLLEDAGLVASDSLRYGGLATAAPNSAELPALATPQSQVLRATTLCTANVNAPANARGEVLVESFAADVAGNATVSQGSYCLDSTATAYLPVSGGVRRCAPIRAGTAWADVKGVASDGSGELVLLRDTGATSELVRFARFAQPYGPGTAHPLPAGLGTAGQVTASAGVVFTTLQSATRSVIVRTRALALAGTGTDDEFTVHTSATERLSGVVATGGGVVYATVVNRDPLVNGGRLVKLPGAFDFSNRTTALPDPAVVTSTSVRPSKLCASPVANELYAAGSTVQGTTRRAALFRINLDAVPVEFTPVWVDTDADRDATACVAVKGGVIVGLEKASVAVIARVDLATAALATPSLLTGWSETTTDVPTGVRGLAKAGAYVFAATDDGANGSLLRFAQDGGF